MPTTDLALLLEAESWLKAGHGVALARVVETWGSAPRPVGSALVVRDDGLFLGSVSGGCVEGEVMAAAADVMADGKPQLLSFGVADETAWRAGLSCGGRISVYVAPLIGARADNLARLNVLAAERQAAIVAIELASGAERLVEGDDLRLDPFAHAMRSGRSGFVEGTQRFLSVHVPLLTMVVIGAVHIAQALTPMARMLGFDPVIVDPRTAFASAERFADVRLLPQWPQEALPALGLDGYSAFIALTHDPKIDDPALALALKAGCFYIGALGSRRTHAKRVERLLAAGFTQTEIDRIRAPVGLAIGAITPQEIAVSIVADVISVWRQGGTAA